MAYNPGPLTPGQTAYLDTFNKITQTVSPILFWISMVGDISMLIFFANDFRKKSSHYRKPYYILLVIGFTYHFCDNIFAKYLLPFIVKFQLPFIYAFNNFRLTYILTFYSIWNATLVLNKFTALWHPLKHDRIWTKNFKKVVLVMLGLPVLPMLYVYANFNCFFYENSEAKIVTECSYRVLTSGFIGSSFVYCLIVFLLVLILIYHGKTVSSFSPNIAKIEKRLMFQALTSLIFYGIYRLIELIGNRLCTFFNDCTPQFQADHRMMKLSFLMIDKIIINIPYLIDISLLIVISKTFRKDFFNFYSFGFYEKLFTKKVVSPLSTKLANMTNIKS